MGEKYQNKLSFAFVDDFSKDTEFKNMNTGIIVIELILPTNFH